MKRLFCTALLVVALSPTAFAAPSFDCSKASGSVEEEICRSPQLQALDIKLAKLYRLAMSQLQGERKAWLKTDEIGWIKGRNDCWKSSDMPWCVAANYRDRITELQIMSQAVSKTRQLQYQCQTLAVTLDDYPDTESPAAMLHLQALPEVTSAERIKPQSLLGFQTPAKPGIKYEAMNVTFRLPQGLSTETATLSRYGKPDQQCQLLRR
ncbi:hypothetical protein NFHSH190041_04560 [Shewanella sp. NFH-SH190041]|uniref:lysozyme inhibitor LprI family protein n=1 Tax=Shewanella sp. NFH-SH190041 TaxID=2950245 RepID=UPI0021C4B573|nr:lysozyme inhibitor LprI family protein [Shewanella sp. NFH-SH190041]BDM63004.1 hypothetical protein NFHSH190041_04560 [Shewanella sp. NFH-SH190041]